MDTPHLNKRFIVKKEQRIIGGAKHPGRTGIVIRANRCDENLLHVKLDATPRAKECEDTLWLENIIFTGD